MFMVSGKANKGWFGVRVGVGVGQLDSWRERCTGGQCCSLDPDP